MSAIAVLSVPLLLLGACTARPPDPDTMRAGESLPERTFDFCQPWSARPAKFVAGRAPIYPVNRFLAGEDGFAVVEFQISSEGKAGKFVNVESSHPAFFTHTKLAIQSWSFEPAIIDGEPVTVHCRLQQNFIAKNRFRR